MKKFLFDILHFTGFVAIAIIVVECIVPENAITFSPIQVNKVKSKDLFIGPFYPNHNDVRDAYGDLAHHTEYEILKKDILWETDALGFRNNKVIDAPDVIFLGTSNIAGYSTSQEKNISSQVSDMTELGVYNMAPYTFDKFTQLLDAKIIDKPKILVFGLIERGLPFLPEIKPRKKSWLKNSFIKLKRTTIFNGLATMIDIPAKRSFLRFVTARLNGTTGNGVQSEINNNMFFFQGKYAKIEPSIEVVTRTADVIESYERYCKEKGIKFIFMPVPNKETIYFEQVPLDEQPKFLEKLHIELQKRNINTIYTTALFNQERKEKLLYHLDDTHWNANGIEIAAKNVAKLITEINKDH